MADMDEPIERETVAIQGKNGVPVKLTEKQEKQKKKNEKVINSYITFISMLGFCLILDTVMRFAGFTTLQKRFNFPTIYCGMLVSIYDVGHVIMLVIVSVIGDKVHRPRLIGLAGLLATVSGGMWSLPHWLYGSGWDAAGNMTDDASTFSKDLCLTSSANLSFGGNMSDPCAGASDGAADAGKDEMKTAFYILLVAQMLLGAALAPCLTVAMTYLDDNSNPATSSAGVTIILTIGSVGSIAGFLVGGLLASVPVDLKPTDLSIADPEWLGCWWIGALGTAVIIFLISLAMMGYPKELPKVPTGEGVDEVDSKHAHMYEKQRRVQAMSQRPMSITSISQFASRKEMKEESKDLFTNCVYLANNIALVAIMYFSSSVFPFLPKYLENQFALNNNMANMITAVVSTGAITAGTFIGGWISASRNLDSLGMAKLGGIGLVFSTGFMAATLFLGCASSPLASPLATESSPNIFSPICKTDCQCDVTRLLPVCGSDELNYLSPCLAGCSAIVNMTGSHMTYGNCSCVSAFPNSTISMVNELGSTVTGWCPRSCPMLYAYLACMFASIFCAGLGESPRMTLVIRSVQEKEKSLALGITNILTSLLSAIPGPMLYGMMIDSTCHVQKPSCDGNGSCVMYDNQMFRWLLHGVTLVCLVVGTLFTLIVICKLSSQERKKGKKVPIDAVSGEELRPMVAGKPGVPVSDTDRV